MFGLLKSPPLVCINRGGTEGGYFETNTNFGDAKSFSVELILYKFKSGFTFLLSLNLVCPQLLKVVRCKNVEVKNEHFVEAKNHFFLFTS